MPSCAVTKEFWLFTATGAEDICAAVIFARERNLSLAAKGGGHSIMGLWKAQNGLTIDLRSLAAKEGITADPEARTARVTGRVELPHPCIEMSNTHTG